jgi:hypothetical protein
MDRVHGTVDQVHGVVHESMVSRLTKGHSIYDGRPGFKTTKLFSVF